MTSLTPTLALCVAGATIAGGALFLPAREPANDQRAGAAADQTGAITIAGFAFSGATAASAGGTITVTNEDSVPHTLTAVDGAFDSGVLEPGASTDLTITTPGGTLAYLCEIHPSMTGELTIDE